MGNHKIKEKSVLFPLGNRKKSATLELALQPHFFNPQAKKMEPFYFKTHAGYSSGDFAGCCHEFKDNWDALVSRVYLINHDHADLSKDFLDFQGPNVKVRVSSIPFLWRNPTLSAYLVLGIPKLSRSGMMDFQSTLLQENGGTWAVMSTSESQVF